MTKQDLRNQIKDILKQIGNNAIRKESEKICRKILESNFFTSCTTLLAYMPLADEADITPVIQRALSQKKKVFLPRIFPETNKMEFYRYDTSTEITQGSFGINEPAAKEELSFTQFLRKMAINEYSPAAHSSNFVDITPHDNPTEHILILVPGRAFTKDGKRLGRGKGFYDIYLSQLPQIFDIKKSGVCFSQQILPDLPTTPDDIMMDFLFSSKP